MVHLELHSIMELGILQETILEAAVEIQTREVILPVAEPTTLMVQPVAAKVDYHM